MKRIGLVVALFILVLALVPSVLAHQTDAPHLHAYNCKVVGSALVCTIEFHHPDWWGQLCPHTIESSYLRSAIPYATTLGCNINAKFQPVPPKGTAFATVRVRDYPHANIVQSVNMKWGTTPAPTPTPVPTPTPTPVPGPHFTGYTCTGLLGTMRYCKVYMAVPVGYNEPYIGQLYSAYDVLNGSSYNRETRIWTLESWFQLPYNFCGQYARYAVFEQRTGRLLDEFRLVSPCP
jgi:hypothetical protein